MRRALGTGAIVAALGVMPVTGALAQEVYRGNDTGGIIAWSCQNEAVAPQIAAAACARWNKYPRITGIHREYGDFISYRCLWSPKADTFALPAVPTRAYCPQGEGAPPPREWPWQWPFNFHW